MGPLNRRSWGTSRFFCYPTTPDLYSQSLYGFIFPVLEPWAVWSGLELGSLAPQFPLLVLICYMWTWGHPFIWLLLLPPCCCLATSTSSPLHPQLPVSAPPTHLDAYFFFKSLVVGLQYSSIFLAVPVVFFCFEINCDSFLQLYGKAKHVYRCLYFRGKSLHDSITYDRLHAISPYQYTWYAKWSKIR